MKRKTEKGGYPGALLQEVGAGSNDIMTQKCLGLGGSVLASIPYDVCKLEIG